MFARKFVDQVDTHADQLCELFMGKINSSERCRELLRKVPAVELQQSIRAIYRDLMNCLLNRTTSASDEPYLRLGMRRAQEGVPLCESFWAVCASRQYFWEYMESETLLEAPADFWGGMEMLCSLDRFFDRTLYFIILGYQTSGNDEHRYATAASPKK
jgi:hypothetical protein